MTNSRLTPVTITRVGGERQLSSCSLVPQPPDVVFPFFASAHNLERLTPAFLQFQILSAPETLRVGSLIDYRIRLHGIPVRWRTRIDLWDPPLRFADRQIRGPFRRWYHLHEFLADGSGTLLRDTVTFDVYCRSLSRTPVLNWIDADLRRIFEHRQIRISAAFGP